MLFVALLALWAQSAQTDWQAEGLKALDEKRYDAAAEDFQKAVQADPKDYAAEFHLALANSLLKKDTEAIAGYRRVLDLKPGLYEAELNLGILLLRNKQPAEALEPLQKAAAAKPNEFRPALYLADALSGAGQSAEAEKAYSAALAIDPKSADGEAGLARVLLAQDRLGESAAHFRKAAELNPSYRDEILRLAEAYESKKQPEEALAIYREFPDNVAARERAAQLLLGLGRAQDAIPDLEMAVKQSPSSANRLALAAAYVQAKEFDKGIALIAQSIQADPKDYDLRMMAGRVLRDNHKLNEAAGQFFAATKIKPDSAEAWSDLASVLILAEDYGKALGALDRVRALNAETPAHFYFRAISLDHLKQLQPALDAYEKFLEADNGKRPDEEFKARQRARILKKEIERR